MTVVDVCERLALDGLRHYDLLHHLLVILVLDGEDAADKDPGPRRDRRAKGDLAEKVLCDLDRAQADVLQQAQRLHFGLHTDPQTGGDGFLLIINSLRLLFASFVDPNTMNLDPNPELCYQ